MARGGSRAVPSRERSFLRGSASRMARSRPSRDRSTYPTTGRRMAMALALATPTSSIRLRRPIRPRFRSPATKSVRVPPRPATCAHATRSHLSMNMAARLLSARDTTPERLARRVQRESCSSRALVRGRTSGLLRVVQWPSRWLLARQLHRSRVQCHAIPHGRSPATTDIAAGVSMV